MINISEVIETNKMIEKENLDVRTITIMVNRIGVYQLFFRLIDAYFLRLPIFLFIKLVFTVIGDK